MILLYILTQHKRSSRLAERFYSSYVVFFQFQEGIEQWGGINLIGGSTAIGQPEWEVGEPDLAMQTIQRRAYNPGSLWLLNLVPYTNILDFY